MDLLKWIGLVAKIQAGQGGAVKTCQILEETRYSRSLTQLRLRQLIKSNYIIRVKRGHYKLNGDNVVLRAIGLSVLLPMDVYEYQSRLSLSKEKNYA